MTQWPAPKPDTTVYIVGDIHGCADKLASLLDRLDADIAAAQDRDTHLVFVGDYIDRGDESAAVLAFLHDLSRDDAAAVTCLVGNHEAMMLDYIDDPIGPARRWLRHGGVQTMASFGVPLPAALDNPSMADLLDAASDLRAAIGDDQMAWLRSLPRSWSSGNLWVVHAGADPEVAMSAQDDNTLIWGHEMFYTAERSDGQWVAVGHQPVEAAFAAGGRIALDTGAVYGRSLTAARITPDGRVDFITS